MRIKKPKRKTPPAPSVAPYLSGQIPKITGDPSPGGILNRPTYVWQGTAPITVTGEWYKNGVGTGVSTDTYSSTVDGDVIEYRESATNAGGSSNQTYWHKVSVSAAAGYRIANANAEIDAMISGLPGGAQNMNIFSSQDHATATYVRNPNLWAAPLVSQLCSAVALKYFPNQPWHSWVHPMQSYGGILITPRHLLYCYHSFPHAQGTWSVGDFGPLKIRFVKPDNSVVEVTQISNIAQPNYDWTPQMIADAELNVPGFISFKGQTVGQGSGVANGWIDLCVAMLDEDMTTHGFAPVPIMRVRSLEEYISLSYDLAGNRLPVIDVSQGYGRVTSSTPFEPPISDYPTQNQTMVAIGPHVRPSEPQSLFDYSVWDGDSGTPTFVIHNGQIYLDGIILTGGWGRLSVGHYYQEVNAMIAAADAGAIALGRLAEPTGYTVTPIELPTP